LPSERGEKLKMHDVPMLGSGLWGLDLSVLIAIVVTCAVVFVLARLGVRNLSVTNPSKMQNFVEWIVEFVQYIIKSNMDMKLGRKFLMLGITLIMFLFVGNMLGLLLNVVTEHKHPTTVFGHEIVSQAKIQEEQAAYLANHPEDPELKHFAGVPVAWWKSPTADVSVTTSLAILVVFLVHFLGLTTNTRNYLVHYLEPKMLLPLSFFLNIIKELAKFLTLNLRLWGNILAGEVLIGVIITMGPVGVVPMVVWLGYSTFVSIIQAFVFTMLTMVYLSMALHNEHDH
jgi:F-type H+-transporting ATPase subunit a